MLKRGDLVRVDVSGYLMSSQPTAYTYGIMTQDCDSTTKLANVALFYYKKLKPFGLKQ